MEDPKKIPFVFAHLSDIHFSRSDDNGVTVYDVDANVRHELILDLKKMRKRLGPFDAIFVTGDIAYSGQDGQYKKAYQWLKEVCAAAECELESVWLIPGNHDVNRKAYEDSLNQSVHVQLRGANRQQYDELVEKHLSADTSRAVLHAAFKAYYEFAKQFECVPTSDKLFWQEDIRLNDGSRLRVRGLNSALTCDGQENDQQHRLILGAVQCLSPREEGVTEMFLCHHPPEWLRDRDDVEDNFRNHAKIQILGHKHRQRKGQIYENLRICAGAVNPDQREPDWLPRYNIVTLLVEGVGEDRLLSCGVYPRVWDKENEEFNGENDRKSGTDCHRYALRLPAWNPDTSIQSAADGVVIPKSQGSPEVCMIDTVDEPAETVKPEYPVNLHRRLTYQFLGLPHHVGCVAFLQTMANHKESKNFILRCAICKTLSNATRDI